MMKRQRFVIILVFLVFSLSCFSKSASATELNCREAVSRSLDSFQKMIRKKLPADRAQLVLDSVSLCTEAGRFVDFYIGETAVRTKKANNSWVTVADKKVDDFLREMLPRLQPSLPVISEEAENASFEERKRWNKFWVFDPIDGTHAFMNGIPDFTVGNIALIEDGIPTLSVVYDPHEKKLYVAEKSLGAWILQTGKRPKQIKWKPKKVRLTKQDQLVVGHSSWQDGNLAPAIELYYPHRYPKIQTSYSLIRSLLQVAEGQVDAFLRTKPASIWDVAAAHAFLLYAYKGRPPFVGPSFDYKSEDLMVPGFTVGLH